MRRFFFWAGFSFLLGLGASAGAKRGRSIGATLNAEALLRLLADRYDAEEGATRLTIPMDGGVPAACRASLLDVAAWSAGEKTGPFLTKTRCDGHDAHVDGALIGGGVLEKRGDRWWALSVDPAIAEFRAFGDFRGEVSEVAVGPNRKGLLLEAGNMHEGVLTGVVALWAERDGRLAEILPATVVSEDGCHGQECVDTVKEQIRFERKIGFRPPLRWAYGSRLQWNAAPGTDWNELVIVTTGTESTWTADRQSVTPVRRTRRFVFSNADDVFTEQP